VVEFGLDCHQRIKPQALPKLVKLVNKLSGPVYILLQVLISLINFTTSRSRKDPQLITQGTGYCLNICQQEAGAADRRFGFVESLPGIVCLVVGK